MLRCNGEKAPPRRPRCGQASRAGALGPSPECALWSSPRERAAGVLPGAGALGNLAIDDSALNCAAWEREAPTAQAPSLPRAAGVTVLPHLGCAHSFQVYLEDGNAESDAADDTPRLSASLSPVLPRRLL